VLILEEKKKVISAFTLSMIAVCAIISLRNLPLTANYGLGSIFFYVVAGLVFFIPTALVAAELSTGWPKEGGIYVWVSEAFGDKYGFLATWLDWVMNVVWNPTVLSFIAATLAYLINPELIEHRFFIIGTMLIVFWTFTFINFLGMKASGLISSIGVILGTIIPGIIIIVLGFVWLFTGHPSQMSFDPKTLIPKMHLDNLVFFSGVLLGLAGMEVAAFHASEVKDPSKNYPKSIFFAVSIILSIFILGTLSVAIVVPSEKISLVAGLMQAIDAFLDPMGLRWATKIFGALLIVGTLAMLSTWLTGPSQGLLVTSKKGFLPATFTKCNKQGMPIHIYILQALIVTALSLVFLFMPTVSSSYWIITALTAQLTTLIYILIFSAAIRLRFSQPDVERPYKVPGGKFGMLLVAGTGILASIFALFIGFVPPKQLETGNIVFYEAFLILGILVLSTPPFIIEYFKKRSFPNGPET
jgi:glutamate:GABA antiporter